MHIQYTYTYIYTYIHTYIHTYIGYDSCKTYCIKNDILQDGPRLHLVASIVSSFTSAVFAAPWDLLLSHYTSAKQQGIHYDNLLHCVRSLIQSQGIFVFYRGWTALWLKLMLQFPIQFPLYEQIRRNVFGLDYFL